jgi:acetolactate synthase-1/2/3 large subunit
MKLSDYVADFLVGHGVKHIFLLPGGGCMHLADSVGRRPEIDYVCCLHEQGCTYAAEVYGEYAGTPGVVLVTAGPGGTNAITGVACAWIESAPMLVISGQAKRSDLILRQRLPVRSMGQQEVDITALVRPITKYAVMVLDPAEIRYHLEKRGGTLCTGAKAQCGLIFLWTCRRRSWIREPPGIFHSTDELT